jgi:hypothetical protein
VNATLLSNGPVQLNREKTANLNSYASIGTVGHCPGVQFRDRDMAAAATQFGIESPAKWRGDGYAAEPKPE